MKCLLCGQDFLPSWALSNVWTRQTLCPTCKIEFVKRGECTDCGKPGQPLCLGLPQLASTRTAARDPSALSVSSAGESVHEAV